MLAVYELPGIKLTEVNDAFLRLLGYPREEVIGKSMEETSIFMQPEQMQEVAKMIRAQNSISNMELQLKCKQGALLEVIFSGEVIEHQGQKSFLSVMFDISAQKQADEVIRHQGALLGSLLDSIPDIIYYKDVQGFYLGCNARFAELVGRPREEIFGATDYDLFERELAEAFFKQDRQMLKLRQPLHNDEWVVYPDGRRVLLDTIKTPYWGPDGKLLGILGISRDVTRRM